MSILSRRSFTLGMLAMEWLMAPSTVAKAAEAGLPEDANAALAQGRPELCGDILHQLPKAVVA